ncbi:MAG: hypothetical protein HETSPECPRED_007117 [Heterodermia speciosa]|uniref:C2H2-type domain-containing protein n=1 Tax=Heterodermia speciosa TaxID=116794 RepID=A0A8H3EMZ9_9LECA|nr:MAG: hypothetical protein HETSPECPRED_007117 [Heterodermia speciosa]
MADVRSMLRNERVARRLNHPHLTYSTTGTLVCLVCHIQLKSEALWNNHLNSNQHAMRLQRIRDNALGRPPGAPPPAENSSEQLPEPTNGSKKRKADDTNGDTRKKSKPANGAPAGFFDEESLYQDQSSDSEPQKITKVHLRQPSDNLPAALTQSPRNHQDQNPTPPTTADPATVDEDEWAAFERDLATPPPEPSALTATATITAAPVSAAELAAQSREGNLQKKSLREIEQEDEKEDAARQMEEELDEMAGFDERVKRLREKREQLRLVNVTSRSMVHNDSDGGGEGDDEHEADDEDDDDDADGFELWSAVIQ